ncbi:MAG: AccI family restriction endonuclease [Bacteroidales bacterium]|nr:MAG: AccI family restriction endonuclease [Bacteroidales bacterium]
MTYYERIRELIQIVPTTIIDWSVERKRGKAPTQAFSEFLTNREQGDWAENLILQAINTKLSNYVAVQYGKSENIVAGESGFEEFYENYQDELNAIGKRPDILLYSKDIYLEEWGNNISNFPPEILNKIVPLAAAGIEVRSSAFLVEEYNQYMQQRKTEIIEKVLQIKANLLDNYKDLLSQKEGWIDVLNAITKETIGVIKIQNAPGWRGSERLKKASDQIKEMNCALKEFKKRDFLSITPKVEDLKVVYKWIETYNVPHFYFQVFFDKVYGISFQKILELISTPELEGDKFFVSDEDSKNQNKWTVKIDYKEGKEVAFKVVMPDHESVMRKLGRGRLLFHVKFNGGIAYLDVNNLKCILGVKENEL